MAITSMGSYSGADCNGMKHNVSSSDLVAMLGPCSRSSPHVGLQVVAPALLVEDGVRALHGGQKRSYAASFDGPTVEDGAELDGDEGGDELSPNLEKKRRLTFDQVRSLERNFEMENKLEPERKMQLAKELGLRPRQVAVWFQNRRARWKTKQLERDYETLAADYERLKTDYEQVVDEKKHLKAEVQRLSGDTLASEHADEGGHQSGNQSGNQCPAKELPAQPGHTEAAAPAFLDFVSRHQNSRSSPTVDVSLACASGSSDVLDADSPRTTDSSSCSALHRKDQSPDLFPPENAFLGDPGMLQPLDGVPVTLEDVNPNCGDGFHELVDQSCNYLLMQLDEPSDVLPWWEWP